MENGNPLVTVVIPTRNRPQSVSRAVKSALEQTFTDLEVIVVIDGPNSASLSALQILQKNDPRVRILPLLKNVGGGDARNAGIAAANGKWIALLDDDDEWMPQKLEKQLALAAKSSCPHPVISCKIVARTRTADYILPRNEPSFPIGDYLLERRGVFQGGSGMYCPTLVAEAALFRMCPFTSGLRRHQDTDWLIRAFRLPEVGLEFLGEPLVLCHYEDASPRVTSTLDWRYSLEWVSRMRSDIAPETYAGFLLTDLAASASNQRDWKAFAQLLANAFSIGKPRALHLALYFGMWILPQRLRQAFRKMGHGRRKQI